MTGDLQERKISRTGDKDPGFSQQSGSSRASFYLGLILVALAALLSFSCGDGIFTATDAKAQTAADAARTLITTLVVI